MNVPLLHSLAAIPLINPSGTDIVGLMSCRREYFNKYNLIEVGLNKKLWEIIGTEVQQPENLFNFMFNWEPLLGTFYANCNAF